MYCPNLPSIHFEKIVLSLVKATGFSYYEVVKLPVMKARNLYFASIGLNQDLIGKLRSDIYELSRVVRQNGLITLLSSMNKADDKQAIWDATYKMVYQDKEEKGKQKTKPKAQRQNIQALKQVMQLKQK